jgi:PilZ domain
VEERRNIKRRKFGYYMRVLDDETLKLVGHLSDISSKGFKIDSLTEIAPNQTFRLRMDLTSEVSNKAYILFSAISRWCQVDPTDPFVQNVGFEITEISSEDSAIYQRIVEKYGS